MIGRGTETHKSNPAVGGHRPVPDRCAEEVCPAEAVGGRRFTVSGDGCTVCGMTTCAYIATSLDGFIAGPDGDIGWLSEHPAPEGDDLGFSEFMDGIDLVIMGRNTFETVLTFGEWPYDRPVWVLSRTLTAVPRELEGRAEVAKGSPAALLESAAQRGFTRVYVDGGAVISSFLAHDLIDEMIVTIIPVVLGGGTRLFGPLPDRLRFSLVKSETLIGQLVKSHYVRRRTT